MAFRCEKCGTETCESDLGKSCDTCELTESRARIKALENQLATARCALLTQTGNLLKTQDCRGTANPIYLVQDTDRIWHATDYFGEEYAGSGYIWQYDDCADVMYKDDEELIDALVNDHECDFPGDTPETLREEVGQLDLTDDSVEFRDHTYEKIHYVTRYKFVCAHFTEKAAESYIACNSHNLSKPRVWVDSQYRCPECNALVDMLTVGFSLDNQWVIANTANKYVDLWWRPGGHGTTKELVAAGLFSKAEAKRLASNRPEQDRAKPLSKALRGLAPGTVGHLMGLVQLLGNGDSEDHVSGVNYAFQGQGASAVQQGEQIHERLEKALTNCPGCQGNSPHYTENTDGTVQVCGTCQGESTPKITLEPDDEINAMPLPGVPGGLLRVTAWRRKDEHGGKHVLDVLMPAWRGEQLHRRLDNALDNCPGYDRPPAGPPEGDDATFWRPSPALNEQLLSARSGQEIDSAHAAIYDLIHHAGSLATKNMRCQGLLIWLQGDALRKLHFEVILTCIRLTYTRRHEVVDWGYALDNVRSELKGRGTENLVALLHDLKNDKRSPRLEGTKT